ncbi:non-ribosomal peptide synthetase [Novipirellula artificiosorum]|uniref:Dimodular nonribosomal peptide synthase n=1 Tax=Novipirellula artificiosorum TaxID=2528016 RepID=A0A5C6DJ48_9BACT|nr:non-ribosomal peptide synthetase [Novipirellula artificiosorum]TWU34946.1 Dimodular nonribosomal peptide synthase [Novipirellula artificiosorum]
MSDQTVNESILIESAESAIGKLLSEASGFELSELDRQASFPELGLDSLFLVQFSQKIKSQLRVKVTFRQLLEEIPSISALVEHVAKHLPDDLVSQGSLATDVSDSVGDTSQTSTGAIPAAEAEGSVRVDPPPTATSPSPFTAEPVAQPPQADTATSLGATIEPVSLPAMHQAPVDAASSVSTDRAGLAAIISQQNELMSLQLQLLAESRRTTPNSSPVNAPRTQTTASAPSAQTATPSELHVPDGDQRSAESSKTSSQPERPVAEKATLETKQPRTLERFGPYKPVRRAADGGLTDRQQQHLDTLIARFTRRTAKSRAHAQQHRPHFADPRGVAGYRRIWKSIVYQIAVDRSRGSKLWDIDGNEYIDIAMGFGLNLFGQSPDFITEAVAEQLKMGVEVGPQSPLAGEVAQLLCDFSRKRRVSFCNTGSEAVMAAMRLARTVTGKSKIVFFNKDYHGNFDQVLVRSIQMGQQRRSQPAAPGVPQALADLTMVLDYGTDEALEAIRNHADDIAAVLVEPVQSANPFMQPSEFLHEVRRITKEKQIALVMDEVITGFRAAPGGAQEWFGVWGDMATYGKVLGGGLPIGALAGSSEYMDALDGGDWRYEDDSEPTADMTFFAGTFVRHPLAMTAAHQVLMKVKEAGPELQQGLTEKTTYLVNSLNAFFEKEQYPFRVAQFTSLFRFMFPPAVEYADLLYFHLLDRGIFTRGWGDNCFLSTAHSDEDIDRIIQAVKDSCNEIRQGGFLPDAEEVEPVGHSARNDTQRKKKLTRFPLTEAQLEIWVTSQMGDKASCSYNEPFFVRFRGSLDADRLCDAIQTVVSRHGELHVRFDTHGSYQESRPPQPIAIDRQDLRHDSSQQREQALAATAKHFGSSPFDLSAGPLIRLQLVTVKNDEHLLFFSAHHLVSDGWSTNLMLGEIAEVYTATLEERPPELPEAAEFCDYVAREASEQASVDVAVSYWKDQFRDLPEPLELPSDRPRPAIKSFAGSTFIHRFSPDVYQATKKVAAENKVTLFSITLSALNVLLARLSGQQDIVVTIPTAGQLAAENPCLVGHCVNLLPIRSQISFRDSFETLVASTQTRVLDAYDHQECTLGRIVRELRVPRDASRLALTEINFNLDRDGEGLEFPELEVEVSQTVKTTSTFDLFFNLNETKQGLELYLDYNSDLYEEETIRRWVGHYETLLRGIADHPTQALGDLPILNEQERKQILVDWNATSAPYPEQCRVEELFEKQVKITPTRVAAIFDNETLTYAELDGRANNLAQSILDHGLTPEEPVGLCIERSLDMVVAVLAILKAGGCFTPIDPDFPDDRIRLMIADSGIRLLVSQPELLSRFGSAPLATLCVEAGNTLAKKPGTVKLTASQTAYTIYTSGSTGQPKGVQLTHRNLVNLLTSISRDPGFTDQDTMLAVTTLSFDIAMAELFLPLVNGGKLVIANQDAATDGDQLLRLLRDCQPTFMQPTPATWKMLLHAGWSGSEGLKIISTGEELPRDLAKKLIGKGAGLWNLYGPSETTIWSTRCRIEDADLPISIGRPIANTQAYILDHDQNPVPIGIPGELHLGGAGLAKGYLNRPELTNDRFIPNPFSDDPAERLYRTGDLTKFRPTGEIDCLGRIDNQIKLRGYRIELEEIESLLADNPAILEGVVVPKEFGVDDQRLVAYVIVRAGQKLDPNAVKAVLRSKLPDYMIPSFVVPRSQLPLTPNGKVDRRALATEPVAELSVEHHSDDKPLEPARNDVEVFLVKLWEKLLTIHPIGVHDNFFDLGGHSLLALRMIAEVERVYGVRLPLASLLQAPTIRALAESAQDGWKPNWDSLVPIQDGNDKLPPLFFIHAAHGNVLLYRELAIRLGKERPIYGLQARGLNGEAEVHTTVQEMATDYLKEIRKVQPQGPYHLGGYCLGGTIAYEISQQLSKEGEAIDLLALFDTTSQQFKETLWTSSYRRIQNIGFHAANLVRRGPRGAYPFVLGKLVELRSRFSRRWAVGVTKLAHATRIRKKPPLQLLEKINDQANDRYVHQPYSGRVTIFKPRKAYSGYDDPTLGWGNGLVQDLDVVELDVYPAGMLMEPYVEELAIEIQRRLSQRP